MIKGKISLIIGLFAMVLATAVVGCNSGEPVKEPPSATSKSVPGGSAAPGTDGKTPGVTPNGSKKGGVAPPPA